MRASYSVFPLSCYVLELFHGSVGATDLFKFARRQQHDARVLKHYHTLSDFTHARPGLSVVEIQQLADDIYGQPASRNGRHALVVLDARCYAFAMVFQSHAKRAGIESQCFGCRGAALRWLLSDSKPPPGAQATARISNAAFKTFPEITV
jgi:hypothetical protein